MMINSKSFVVVIAVLWTEKRSTENKKREENWFFQNFRDQFILSSIKILVYKIYRKVIAFHFQCKTLFTIMIYVDTIMTKCNSSE